MNPVQALYKALQQCPDAAPSPTTAGLEFISDPDFRHELRIDISTAEQALTHGEWKAATVLAGAVVEALLLWALQQVGPAVYQGPGTPSTPLDGWSLHQYIAVAEQCGIIDPTTAIQARLAKDFRNFIHPGRTQRQGESCTQSTAMTALAAAIKVTEVLAARAGHP